MVDDEKINRIEKYIESLSYQEKWKLIEGLFGLGKPDYFDDNNYTWSFSDSTT